MEIDFNNVRRLAICDYNRVVRSLISELGGKFYSDEMSETRDALEDLRMKLAAIAGSCRKNDPDFKDLTDEAKFTNI